jgi:hypothetical protein
MLQAKTYSLPAGVTKPLVSCARFSKSSPMHSGRPPIPPGGQNDQEGKYVPTFIRCKRRADGFGRSSY